MYPRTLLPPFLLACWLALQLLLPSPMLAQGGNPAESADLVLECQGCSVPRAPVQMLPGRKMKVYGPPNTAPIMGRLVHGGDTVALDVYQRTRLVPAKDITAITVTNPMQWLKLLLLHVIYLPIALIAALALALASASFWTVIGVLVLPYVFFLTLILLTNMRSYRMPFWRIRR